MNSLSPPFVFFHPFPFAAEFIALPLLWLLVFSIHLVINTNIHMAERSRLLLTQWPDFDSWSETEESDEDVRRYKFLFRSPSSGVLDLAWPRFCSHLHLSSLLLSEEMLASTALSVFSFCISGSVVHEHTHTQMHFKIKQKIPLRNCIFYALRWTEKAPR